jgi:hypothetical protein
MSVLMRIAEEGTFCCVRLRECAMAVPSLHNNLDKRRTQLSRTFSIWVPRLGLSTSQNLSSNFKRQRNA